MAVKLRLKRMGKKRQPIYKVVAADSRSPRDGKFLESIGLYNPKTDPATINIEAERALYWLSVGAKPTDTVRNLLNKKGILLKRELLKKGLSEEEISLKLEEWTKQREAKSEVKEKKAAKTKKEVETPKETAVKDNAEVEGTTSETNPAEDSTD